LRALRCLPALALLTATAACTSSGSAAPAAALKTTAAPETAAKAATATAGTSSAAVTTPKSVPAVTRPPATSLTIATASWRLPSPLSRMVALAAPGGGIELLGGLLNGDHSSAQVQHVTLPGGVVTPDGTLAVGVHDSAGAVVGSGMFVYAGGAASEVAVVQRAVTGGTAVTAGALPQRRSDLVVATVGDQVVVLGGYDGTRTLADVLVSRAGAPFSVLAKLPVPVRYPAFVVRGHTVLLYGGDVDRKPTDVIQRVDLSTGRATVAGHLPHPIGHAAAVVLGGAVWLAGGTTPSGTSASIYRSTDGVTFRAAGALPGPRSDEGVVVVGGVAYLIGGETPTRTATVVTLSPPTG
jgi:hypothetical protein